MVSEIVGLAVSEVVGLTVSDMVGCEVDRCYLNGVATMRSQG